MIELPQIGLGCAPIGNMRQIVSDAEAHSTLASAYDNGCTYFDTAPWYGNTLSELRVGRFLGEIDREKVKVSTKVGRVYDANSTVEAYDWWAGGLEKKLRFDYSGEGVLTSLAGSNERLGAEPDLLVIHDLDAHYHNQEVFESHWQALSKSGFEQLIQIRDSPNQRCSGLGAGINEGCEGLIPKYLNSFPEIDFFLVAMPYTLLSQNGKQAMDMCLEAGKTIVIGSPYASGILATVDGNYGYETADDTVRNRLSAIAKVCDSHEVNLKAAALQFPLRHPAVESVIPGAISPAQSKENMKLIEADIPNSFWQDLTEMGLIDN